MQKRIVVILMIGLIGLYAFAGGGGEPKPAEEAKLEAEAKAGEPKYGGTITIATGSAPPLMDIHMAPGWEGPRILMHVTESLLFLYEGKLQPQLAESWEVNEDATEFIFHIRKGIKFHDGEPLNAEAVKINLDRKIDPEVPGTGKPWLAAPVKEITVLDEYTLKITTKVPNAPLLSTLAVNWYAIQSPKSLKASWKEPVTKPVGTGPFMFKEFVPGVQAVLVRNPDYWGAKPENADVWVGQPYVDELVFKPIPDNAARMVALESGAVDIAINIPPRDVMRLESNPDTEVSNKGGASSQFLLLNNSWGPLKDKRVRQALNYAANKKAIVDNIFNGAARISDCYVAPAVTGYVSTKVFEHNPDKAKQLLAEAGYPDGFEIDLYIPVGRYPQAETAGAAIAADWTRVGVQTNIKMVESSTWLEYWLLPPEEAVMPATMGGSGPGNFDVDSMCTMQLLSTNTMPHGRNFAQYNNPKFDELLIKGRGTGDPEERLKVYAQMWEIMMEDAPVVFLYAINDIVGYRANIHDVVFDAAGYQWCHHAWKD